MRDNPEFRNKILNGKDKIDYYFDDATHDYRYLIPLFEIIIPLCASGAVIGTHDANDELMAKFLAWLRAQPSIEKTIDGDNSFFAIVK